MDSFRTMRQDGDDLNDREELGKTKGGGMYSTMTSKGLRLKSHSNSFYSPIQVELPSLGEDIGVIHNVIKVACGDQHTLALTQRGHVFAWGQARYGALGIDFNSLSNDSKGGVTQGKTLANQYEAHFMGMHSADVSSPHLVQNAYANLNFKGIDIMSVE